ncbi:MAG: hypothetical protein A2787_04460 [Omnitrophica WOR_2 bacterium RIFCSPHIGHO2_01_FULL_48_9]|nr:MAG: hypothetical protein A2787_04460 [Omnitrophica WOR_2 bacterium RIFCSPHIGHO2_01_FULL_48_9]
MNINNSTNRRIPIKKVETPQDKLTYRADSLALFICIAVFLFWISFLTFKYYHFGYYDWDLAMYAQAMWSLTQGSVNVSLFGTNFLTNHAEYISFVLVPLYAIFQHPLTLITLKIFSVTAGAYIFYLIAQPLVGWRLSIFLMILYLFYPANLYMLLYEFHFENLAVVFIFLLYFFYTNDRLVPFAVTALLMSLIKENITLIPIMFGIYAVFSKRTNKLAWVLIPVAIGASLFYLSQFVITPHLRAQAALPYSNQYIGAYASLGTTPKAIAQTMLFNPPKLLSLLATDKNAFYFQQLFGPLFILPFFNPQTLFLGLPIFLQHLLSASPTTHTIYYHYTATVVPFIFLATAHSFNLLKRIVRPWSFLLTIIFIVVTCIVSTIQHRDNLLGRITTWADDLDPNRWQMSKTIPPTASVVATFDFLAELSQRSQLYSLHNVWRNNNPFTYQAYHLPETEYALIDWKDPWLWSDLKFSPEFGSPKDILGRLKDFHFQNTWSVVHAANHVTLLQKGGQGPHLVELSRKPFREKKNSINLSVDQKFHLLNYEMGHNHGALLPMTFYWRADKTIEDIYFINIRLTQNGKTVLTNDRNIGYPVLATLFWQKGDYIKENYWLFLPQLPPGQYVIQLSFFNLTSGKAAELVYKHPAQLQSGNTFKIGTITIQ